MFILRFHTKMATNWPYPPMFGYKPLSQSDTYPATSCYIPIRKKKLFWLVKPHESSGKSHEISISSIHFHPFSIIGRNPNCGLLASLGP